MESDEEFTLPVALPAQPHSEPSLPSAPPFLKSNSRKRPFLRSQETESSDPITTSSDPALFSSDETPDVENYSSDAKRRKRKTYAGTWWGDRLRKTGADAAPTGKRQFQRNLDSGIFMCDDSSASDFSSEGLLEQELLDDQERKKDKTQVATNRSFIFDSKEVETPSKRITVGPPIHPKDHLVRDMVRECLDKNDENVDLTGCGLDSLSPAITDLKSLIKRIDSDTIQSQPVAFEAQLKIYLGNNDFTQLPLPLWDLTNTQILSVRQNRLETLPPGIRALVNLQELNISSNNLRCLPYEVLKLFTDGQLKTMYASPNPWMPVPPIEERFTQATPLELKTRGGVTLRRWAISRPVELSPDGRSRQIDGIGRETNCVPHLREMTLRALLRHNTSRSDLSTLLSPDDPHTARSHLATLFSTQLSGGRRCTFCGRDIVLPTQKWYEWWQIDKDYAVSAVVATPLETDSPSPSSSSPLLPEIPPDVSETLIPFERMSCACVDVTTGLLLLRERKGGEDERI